MASGTPTAFIKVFAAIHSPGSKRCGLATLTEAVLPAKADVTYEGGTST